MGVKLRSKMSHYPKIPHRYDLKLITYSLLMDKDRVDIHLHRLELDHQRILQRISHNAVL